MVLGAWPARPAKSEKTLGRHRATIDRVAEHHESSLGPVRGTASSMSSNVHV
jgi:hypothetical protein